MKFEIEDETRDVTGHLLEMVLIATRNQELFLAEQRHLHKSSLATSCCGGSALWLGAVSATARYCGSAAAAAAAVQPQPYA